MPQPRRKSKIGRVFIMLAVLLAVMIGAALTWLVQPDDPMPI